MTYTGHSAYYSNRDPVTLYPLYRAYSYPINNHYILDPSTAPHLAPQAPSHIISIPTTNRADAIGIVGLMSDVRLNLMYRSLYQNATFEIHCVSRRRIHGPHFCRGRRFSQSRRQTGRLVPRSTIHACVFLQVVPACWCRSETITARTGAQEAASPCTVPRAST
jgi:hypothetical protein